MARLVNPRNLGICGLLLMASSAALLLHEGEGVQEATEPALVSDEGANAKPDARKVLPHRLFHADDYIPRSTKDKIDLSDREFYPSGAGKFLEDFDTPYQNYIKGLDPEKAKDELMKRGITALHANNSGISDFVKLLKHHWKITENREQIIKTVEILSGFEGVINSDQLRIAASSYQPYEAPIDPGSDVIVKDEKLAFDLKKPLKQVNFELYNSPMSRIKAWRHPSEQGRIALPPLPPEENKFE